MNAARTQAGPSEATGRTGIYLPADARVLWVIADGLSGAQLKPFSRSDQSEATAWVHRLRVGGMANCIVRQIKLLLTTRCIWLLLATLISPNRK